VVRTSTFYQDFALRHSRRFLMAAHLIKTDQISSLAGLHRTPAQGPFSDRDLIVFEGLKPHLRRAAQIQMRMEEIEAARQTAHATLDQLSFGVITLDRDGKVLSINRSADEAVAAEDGLTLRAGRLAACDYGSADDLAEALRAATEPARRGGRLGASLLIERASGLTPYRLLVAPLADGTNARFGQPSRATALVLISDPERMTTPPEEHLRGLFGLTKAEAQVALAVLAGKRLEDVAEERSVSLGTVRCQMKSLLEKTGTGRQAELIRSLLTVPTVNQN
jgi:DNA-binding CsgD family transcriptional regulator